MYLNAVLNQIIEKAEWYRGSVIRGISPEDLMHGMVTTVDNTVLYT